jgi:hypothetical protein
MLCPENKGYCDPATGALLSSGEHHWRDRTVPGPSLSSKQVRVFRSIGGAIAVMESLRRRFDSKSFERAKGKTGGTSCLRSDLGGKSSYSKICL